MQLKTPNWLYGQKRSGDNNVAKSDAEISLQAHATKLKENNKELEDMNWLTAQIPRVEEELFTRYTIFFFKSILSCFWVCSKKEN